MDREVRCGLAEALSVRAVKVNLGEQGPDQNLVKPFGPGVP